MSWSPHRREEQALSRFRRFLRTGIPRWLRLLIVGLITALIGISGLNQLFTDGLRSFEGGSWLFGGVWGSYSTHGINAAIVIASWIVSPYCCYSLARILIDKKRSRREPRIKKPTQESEQHTAPNRP